LISAWRVGKQEIATETAPLATAGTGCLFTTTEE